MRTVLILEAKGKPDAVLPETIQTLGIARLAVADVRQRHGDPDKELIRAEQTLSRWIEAAERVEQQPMLPGM